MTTRPTRDSPAPAATHSADTASVLPGEPVRSLVVAIDGPAGSGKSTVARALAERLKLGRLDTGAMYRAVAWAALQRRIDLTDRVALGNLAGTITIAVGDTVEVDGVDITEVIRDEVVSHAVSTVAAAAEVRAVLVGRQRKWVESHGGGIVEGRDIGSVVLPDADLKIYLTASAEERVRRRAEEGAAALARRDRIDSTRSASPLVAADDARVIDTTGRSPGDVVDDIVSWLDLR